MYTNTLLEILGFQTNPSSNSHYLSYMKAINVLHHSMNSQRIFLKGLQADTQFHDVICLALAQQNKSHLDLSVHEYHNQRSDILIGTFLQSLLIGYSGAIMPGPLLTYNINQSMRVGIRSGLLLIAGHAILELLTIIILFLGLGTFLSTNTAQLLIGSAGGTVLVVLGILMIKDLIQGKAKLNVQEKEKERSGGLILNGIVISALNPYFIIWWTVVGLGMMLAANRTYGLIGIVVFFAGHMLADFSWYMLVSFLISRTQKIINEKAYKIIVVILAMVLVGFGVKFLVDATTKMLA